MDVHLVFYSVLMMVWLLVFGWDFVMAKILLGLDRDCLWHWRMEQSMETHLGHGLESMSRL
jgi:hypothetical protein